MSKVIGIDCGLRGMGYAVAEAGSNKLIKAGAFLTKKSSKKQRLRAADDDIRCVQDLVGSLLVLVRQHTPAAVFVEVPSAGAKGARANRAMGLSTGLLVAILETLKIPVSYLLPTDVRRILCGKASASKEDAAAQTLMHFGGDPFPGTDADGREHAIDAAAVLWASENDPLYRMAAR